MGFTKETLWTLRKEIVLNSLFIADYRNSLNIDPHMLCNYGGGNPGIQGRAILRLPARL